MKFTEREDDFEIRRKHLQCLSDEALHTYFFELIAKITNPLVEEARTHTTPSIERSVLLRMGFSSTEARALVAKMQERELLGYGAGRLVLELTKLNSITVLEAGAALLAGKHWEDLPS